jgi:DNA-directed RNA polymerase subunit beta
MRDEDDDLLRAAEELGIDLSGVRAPAGGPADEALEDEDSTDAVAVDSDDGDEDTDEAAEALDENLLDADVESLEGGVLDEALVEDTET